MKLGNRVKLEGFWARVELNFHTGNGQGNAFQKWGNGCNPIDQSTVNAEAN